jgi:3alpha(or 20beta)-hydroxysteroid dehydrogenase
VLNFSGRTVIITGGAGGIGRTIARRFVDEGATVIAADIDTAGGAELVDRLGGHCKFFELDVTDVDAWNRLAKLVAELGQPLAGLINTAGVVEYKTIAEGDPAAFRRILDVNVFGTWLGIHTLSAQLRAAGDGVLVNFSSTQGLEAKRTMAAYAASKWAVRGLTKTAALEFARDGVRVCSVHPGPTRTPMTAHLNPAQVLTQPIPRFGEPDEVAAMVWFIASQATYSTGSEFVIDGGVLLGALPAPE